MLLFFLLCMFWFSKSQELPNSCESPVYCYGDLLHTAQMTAVFPNDSKTFVDLKMRYPPSIVLQNFEQLKQSVSGNITTTQMQEFVSQNFEAGQELANWTLADFNPNPSFVQRITNETVRNFTQALLLKWPELARHVKDEVNANPEQYSLIYVPNGFIIPGGRFREYYYWDSYWIIEGLLISEMTDTARGMIENFLTLVERFGFMPNGGRVYYLQRSQPPLLTPMAHLYYQHTKNVSWVKHSIDTLAKELKYWDNQTVTIRKGLRTYTMAHYFRPSKGPRPESYREDIRTASYYQDETQQQELYNDLKSGAESGWDFSSRWIFDANGGNKANLSHIQTRRVVPVDLNAFLCGAYRDISELYAAILRPLESALWLKRHLQLRRAIQDVLWDDLNGTWYDYDLQLSQLRRSFYPSSVTPLWSRCFDELQGQYLGKRVSEYLKAEKILDFLGGIPTSEEYTLEQWDFPNAWPPLQSIVVQGLENSGYAGAKEEAAIFAKRWVAANIIGYQKTGAMFEKYDAVIPGQYGGGGEYEVQDGFGWTNGIALQFINDYFTNRTALF